jgi:5-methylcytosine-specific restriction endonuclease McrA
MNRQIELTVRRRAGGVCEYCRLPESLSHLPFPLDHIIARQHGGQTAEDNLALACPECNLQKGPNLTGIDPKIRAMTRLFNPRDHGGQIARCLAHILKILKRFTLHTQLLDSH